MSAGTGVRHSEFNHVEDRSRALPADLDHPERGGMPPGYEQKRFADAEKRGRLRLVRLPTAATARFHPPGCPALCRAPRRG